MKDFLSHEWNCNSTTKVNGTCYYGGECMVYCVVYRVRWKLCKSIYMLNNQNTHKIWTEEHLQYAALKVQWDKNSDNVAAIFNQFSNQNPDPQQCH